MAQWNSQFNSRWKREFRRQLAERFGCKDWEYVKCSRCKRKANVEKDRRIEIHHVYASSEFPDLRLEIDNVVPMCNTCHDKFHKKYDVRIGRTIIKVATAEHLQIFLDLRANHILNSIE